MCENLRNKLDFNSICRICLKGDTLLDNIFETDAPNMLKFCGFLEVDQGDEYPDKICALCNTMLIQSYKLKQLCISSKLYLETWLDAQGNSEADTIMEKEDNENEISNNAGFIYECSKCEEQSISKEHCCQVSNDKDDNIGVLSSGCDMNEVLQTPIIDENEVSAIINKYNCPNCNLMFEHEQDLLAHQSIHGDSQKCNVCGKIFKTSKHLKRHLKTHMITKSHVCKICNKGFAESSDVVKHAKRHHLGIPREKNYGCTECGQRFTDQYYLKVHQRKHTGEKPLECNMCDKSFYDPRSLRVHLDAHKGLKPYLCSYCGKSFHQNAHLKQHLLVHSEEKPYSCTICDKRFTQSTSLHRHQKVHRETQKCDICLKGFSKLQQLHRHKEEEHGVKRKKERKKASD